MFIGLLNISDERPWKTKHVLEMTTHVITPVIGFRYAHAKQLHPVPEGGTEIT
jgi:hypothetical protein